MKHWRYSLSVTPVAVLPSLSPNSNFGPGLAFQFLIAHFQIIKWTCCVVQRLLVPEWSSAVFWSSSIFVLLNSFIRFCSFSLVSAAHFFIASSWFFALSRSRHRQSSLKMSVAEVSVFRFLVGCLQWCTLRLYLHCPLNPHESV